LLSGIGDAAELRAMGIAPVLHVPGVGRNLRDHVDFVIAYRSRRKDLIGFMPGDLVNALRSSICYRRERRGIFTSNIAEAGGFVKSLPGIEVPDLQLHFCIGILENHGRKLHANRGFSCHVCVLRPKSAGRVSLQSVDPLDKAGGYAAQEDQGRLIEYIEGSMSNVIGLPVERVLAAFNEHF
jgi:choline dehydrogenase-like flavoprotein